MHFIPYFIKTRNSNSRSLCAKEKINVVSKYLDTQGAIMRGERSMIILATFEH